MSETPNTADAQPLTVEEFKNSKVGDIFTSSKFGGKLKIIKAWATEDLPDGKHRVAVRAIQCLSNGDCFTICLVPGAMCGFPEMEFVIVDNQDEKTQFLFLEDQETGEFAQDSIIKAISW